MKSILFELNQFGYNFMEPKTPGCLFVSSVIFSKLPRSFCKELARISNTNFPDVNMIFDQYGEIITGLKISNNQKPSIPKGTYQDKKKL